MLGMREASHLGNSSSLDIVWCPLRACAELGKAGDRLPPWRTARAKSMVPWLESALRVLLQSVN